MKTSEKIKEIEKDIEILQEGCNKKQEPEGEGMILDMNDNNELDFIVCGRNNRYCGNCVLKLRDKFAKLQVYKEWEQREKEILEEEIKFLKREVIIMTEEADYGTSYREILKRIEELKQKLKGEKKCQT